MCRSCCRANFVVAGIEPSVTDVVGHTGRKDRRLLSDHTDAGAQLRQTTGRGVEASHPHAPLLRGPKAQNQLKDCGLARAGRSDQGPGLAHRQSQRKIVEDHRIRARRVRKAHRVKLHRNGLSHSN